MRKDIKQTIVFFGGVALLLLLPQDIRIFISEHVIDPLIFVTMGFLIGAIITQ